LKSTRSGHGEAGQERQEKELEFRVMAKLTPKSILGKIWYGSQGLHLIGARIRI
jgi:hypothetical protein